MRSYIIKCVGIKGFIIAKEDDNGRISARYQSILDPRDPNLHGEVISMEEFQDLMKWKDGTPDMYKRRVIV